MDYKKTNLLQCSFLALILLLAGCKGESTQKTPEQLFDEYASGVVLIYCEYYYSITLPTGETLYMTGLSDTGEVENVTTDEVAMKQNCNRQFGTGFFIDSKGDIMTNRHVVDVSIDEIEAQERFVASLRRERQSYIDSMEMARRAYAELEEKKKNATVKTCLEMFLYLTKNCCKRSMMLWKLSKKGLMAGAISATSSLPMLTPELLRLKCIRN